MGTRAVLCAEPTCRGRTSFQSVVEDVLTGSSQGAVQTQMYLLMMQPRQPHPSRPAPEEPRKAAGRPRSRPAADQDLQPQRRRALQERALAPPLQALRQVRGTPGRREARTSRTRARARASRSRLALGGATSPPHLLALGGVAPQGLGAGRSVSVAGLGPLEAWAWAWEGAGMGAAGSLGVGLGCFRACSGCSSSSGADQVVARVHSPGSSQDRGRDKDRGRDRAPRAWAWAWEWRMQVAVLPGSSSSSCPESSSLSGCCCCSTCCISD